MKKKLFLLPLFAMVLAGCTGPTTPSASDTTKPTEQPSTTTPSVDPSVDPTEPVVETIAIEDAHDLGAGDKGQIEGVIAKKTKQAILVEDATGVMTFQHFGKLENVNDFNIGDHVKVNGEIANYHEINQFAASNKDGDILATIEKVDGTATASTKEDATAMDAAAWDALYASLVTPTLVSVRATVFKSGTYINFKVGDATNIGTVSYAYDEDNICVEANVGKVFDTWGWVMGKSTSPRMDMIVMGHEENVSETPVTSVTVEGAAEVKVGENITLTHTVLPAEAAQSVTWESSDETKATVAAGKVTGVAEGTVTITAKSVKDPTKLATHEVTVTANAELKNAVVLTVDSLGVPSQSYAAGENDVQGVTVAYNEIGNYGSGIQCRDKDGSRSTIWNKTAFAKDIVKVTLEYNAEKYTKFAPQAFGLAFGAETQEATEITTAGYTTESGVTTYEVNVEAGNKFFKLYKVEAKHAQYFNKIVIHLAD